MRLRGQFVGQIFHEGQSTTSQLVVWLYFTDNMDYFGLLSLYERLNGGREEVKNWRREETEPGKLVKKSLFTFNSPTRLRLPLPSWLVSSSISPPQLPQPPSVFARTRNTQVVPGFSPSTVIMLERVLRTVQFCSRWFQTETKKRGVIQYQRS